MLKRLILFIFTLSVFAFAQPLWLRYPAISPNGQEIIFNFKGDIFKVSSSGGNAFQLTSNAAYDFKAVWSPDGKYFAFASDRHGNFDIYLMPVTGGEPKRLTFHSFSEVPEAFSEDGKEIYFSSYRQMDKNSAMFPRTVFTQLYKVNIDTGEVKMVLSTPAQELDLKWGKIVYQDRRGLEDKWRKHHTSSTTRDIWIYDLKDKTHKKMTDFKGEDLYPVFSPDLKNIYYLSEEFGSANVCKKPVEGGKTEQITAFKNHPVRFLSVSKDNKLCFSYNGEIYLKQDGKDSQKVNIYIRRDRQKNNIEYKTFSSGVSEMSISPSGKEIAFIKRGEIYVTSTDYSTTKRITSTPQQERSVSFSSNGRRLVYAAERDGSWNIYMSEIVSPNEKYFALATLIKEEKLVDNGKATFQPKFSPDGKEVAFLEDRTTLRVLNLKSKKIRTIVSGEYNFSYSDGDIEYQWSPDSKYLLLTYLGVKRWNNDIGLVKADGKGKVVNLTKSGYSHHSPQWVLGGNAMIWLSNAKGMRSHGSWGSQDDVFIMFFNQKSYNKFILSKEETEILNEEAKSKKGGKDKKSNSKKEVKPVNIDTKGLEYRTLRITPNSSNLSAAVLSNDGKKLYYLSRFEKGYDLWSYDIKESRAKLLKKFQSYGHSLNMDKKGKNLFLVSGSQIMKVSTAGKLKSVPFKAEFDLDYSAEKAYLFSHVWQEVLDKFYDKDLLGVDWKLYKENYEKMLPYINNNYDFAEMLSEMLGELNASHTGCRYRSSKRGKDVTACLGVFLDYKYKGEGVKLDEIMPNSPLRKTSKNIKDGTIIEKIDGKKIKVKDDYYKYLNHKAGKKIVVSFYDSKTQKRWNEVVTPISYSTEGEMLYKRWVEKRREDTHKFSNGRIGYVHVRSMNDKSFRDVYSQMFGMENDKEAIVIDTRFNGGGSLHEDLAKLLSGKPYFRVVPRGNYIGTGPRNQWYKPSIVLMSEANYSNAHGFPYVYKKLGLGKLVGMPVPGTMTSVWWERLIDPTLVFGIPIVGRKDEQGRYLENLQLEPDVKVQNDFTPLSKGEDQQLKKAVELLLDDLNKKEKK